MAETSERYAIDDYGALEVFGAYSDVKAAPRLAAIQVTKGHGAPTPLEYEATTSRI